MQPIVIKLGGTTLTEEDTLAGVAEAATLGSLVVVHGGGKTLSDWLDRLGIETRFEDGLRVTGDDALEVAVAVLGGIVNAELVAALRGLGARAVGLTGIDGGLLKAERLPALGRVGHVVGVDPAPIDALLDAGMLPVVAPLTVDEAGAICNVNADEAAAALAGALGARLILLTDTDGVRDAEGRTIDRLDPETAEQLINRGVIGGGMIPKVRGALAVLKAGAAEVVIADGRLPGAARRALRDEDFGTHIRAAD